MNEEALPKVVMPHCPNRQLLQGQKALVTGANRGIGRAIAESLLERGVSRLYAGARDPQAVSELKERYGDRVIPLRLDVTDANQVSEAVASAGDVQVLVNNAGVAQVNDFLADDALEQARTEMEVNYFAPLDLIRRFAPVLQRNGGGAIINVASVGGLTNFPPYPTYSASKAAIHSLTQGARILLAAQGIEVYGVYPGPVDTGYAHGEFKTKITNMFPDRRWGTPDDVANLVGFLVSDEGAWIRGEVINSEGGFDRFR